MEKVDYRGQQTILARHLAVIPKGGSIVECDESCDAAGVKLQLRPQLLLGVQSINEQQFGRLDGNRQHVRGVKCKLYAGVFCGADQNQLSFRANICPCRKKNVPTLAVNVDTPMADYDPLFYGQPKFSAGGRALDGTPEMEIKCIGNACDSFLRKVIAGFHPLRFVKNRSIKSCIFIFLTEQGVHAPSFQLAKQGIQRRCGIGKISSSGPDKR